MRNWNNLLLVYHWKNLQVFTVPMRNWNPSKYMRTLPFATVFTVPMRNWNIFLLPQIFLPNLFLQYLWGIETQCWLTNGKEKNKVFTVPMRNWNTTTTAATGGVSAFLQYLWGIETQCSKMSGDPDYMRFYSTYEELKHVRMSKFNPSGPVFTVPMRNWNS